MAKRAFSKMSADELEKATAQFDAEFVPTTPLRASDRAKHRRAKVGRPRVGAGVDRFSVTVEAGLMSRAEKYAKAANLSRSALVAAGLRLLLEQNGVGALATKRRRRG